MDDALTAFRWVAHDGDAVGERVDVRLNQAESLLRMAEDELRDADWSTAGIRWQLAWRRAGMALRPPRKVEDWVQRDIARLEQTLPRLRRLATPSD